VSLVDEEALRPRDELCALSLQQPRGAAP